MLSEAVKKLSSKYPHTLTSQHTKKSFFSTGKITANLQPWPSATNLARYNAQNHTTDIPLSTISINSATDNNQEPNATPRRKSSLKVRQCPHYNLEIDDQGIVNSAFSPERLSESWCYTGGHEKDATTHDYRSDSPCDDVHSDVYPCSFSNFKNICNHRLGSPRLQKHNNCPKFLVRRQRSMGSGGSGKKKGVRWKSVIDYTGETTNRRKTVDCVPTAEKIVAQAAATAQSLWRLSENDQTISTKGRDPSSNKTISDNRLPDKEDKEDKETES